MNTLITVMMYLMWTVTIIAILAATFTSFRYEDLNVLAIVLVIFSALNAFFVISKRK